MRNFTERLCSHMNRRPTVALLVESSNAYARGVLEGIMTYVRRHRAWTIYLPEQERGAAPPQWLADWPGDGIIARIENEAIAEVVRRSRLPTVDVSAARRLDDIPWVETDDVAIAQLAADHFTERGFRNLAFCGVAGFNWSQWREQAFAKCARQAGCSYSHYESTSRYAVDYSWSRERQRLAEWVGGLPRPLGIMACYDIQARELLDVCRELDIAIPEEIALIGVDNDRLLCSLATPPLSSVIPDAQRAGYESAKLLDRMMAGEPVEGRAHLIEPLGIESRQSSDALAIDDVDVARALRFIREHACDAIQVGDVLKHVDISRRVLENRFGKLLGRTPHAEILRVRIGRVRELLRDRDLTLLDIADRTGFEHVEYLSTVFRRETGETPTQFRSRIENQ